MVEECRCYAPHPSHAARAPPSPTGGRLDKMRCFATLVYAISEPQKSSPDLSRDRNPDVGFVVGVVRRRYLRLPMSGSTVGLILILCVAFATL